MAVAESMRNQIHKTLKETGDTEAVLARLLDLRQGVIQDDLAEIKDPIRLEAEMQAVDEVFDELLETLIPDNEKRAHWRMDNQI